jgi:uncharacterized protein (DUF58 family)
VNTTREDGVPSLFIIPLIQFFVVCILFVSLLHGQGRLALLCLLVLAMGLGTRVWSRAGGVRLRCHIEVDKNRLFPGEHFKLSLRAQNGKFLPIWLQVRVSFDRPVALVSPAAPIFEQDSGLLWYQHAYFDWELTAPPRGVYQVGSDELRVADFFGFFPRRKVLHDMVEVLVYPRLISLNSLPLPERDWFGRPGRKGPVRDPVYLLGTRDYGPSHPARFIHWKASARHQRLQEKIFEPTTQRKVLLVVDVAHFAASGTAEEFERTLETAGSLAVRLSVAGCALGLVTNGRVQGRGLGVIPVANNARQAAAILELLARLQMQQEESLVDTMNQGLRRPWGLSCVHFSYGQGDDIATAQTYFTTRGVPVSFVVSHMPPEWRDTGTLGYATVCGLDDLRAGGEELR